MPLKFKYLHVARTEEH